MPKGYKPIRRLKPKHSRLKKIARSRLFWFGMAGFVVVAGIVYGVFFTPFLQIQYIEIAGNQKVATEKLEQIVKESLPRKILFFEINHLLLADARGAGKEVLDSFPELESVAVQKKFPDAVRITVQEREPVAVWCNQFALSPSTALGVKRCFALDKHGIVFEEKPARHATQGVAGGEPEREVVLSAEARYRTVPGEGREAVLGGQVVEPALLANILRFQQALDASALFQQVGLRVSLLQIISPDRVNGKISEGWEVYFNPSENIDWQITKLKLVLEQEIPFQQRPFLEYIELRFGDQAYIKYR